MNLKRIRKPLIWLVALGVPGGLCWLAYLFYTIDEDPPPDGHLRPDRPAVAFEENGFHLLDFSPEQVYWPEENRTEANDMAFTEAWDGRLAADLLEDLQDAGGAPPDAGDEAWPEPNEPTFRIDF